MSYNLTVCSRFIVISFFEYDHSLTKSDIMSIMKQLFDLFLKKKKINQNR